MSITRLRKKAKGLANKRKIFFFKRFFKTAKGEYAEGDKFIGLNVPQARKLAKEFWSIELEDVHKLLDSNFHEYRLIGILILLYKSEKTDFEPAPFLLKHIYSLNNWDLVDLAAPKIFGPFYFKRNKSQILKWAKSKSIWEKRLAIMTTSYFIKKGKFSWTLKICRILLQDENDLIHKACGWMLREVGKQDQNSLLCFIKEHYELMPRAMLRYSIERFSETKRKKILKGNFT